MRRNVKMGLMDLSVAQVQRRHVLSTLPDLSGSPPPDAPNRWLVTWLLVGAVFTVLLTWLEIGGQP